MDTHLDLNKLFENNDLVLPDYDTESWDESIKIFESIVYERV